VDKLIDKARKLKALAERGNGGEQDTAKRFYRKFIKENKISEKEIEEDYLIGKHDKPISSRQVKSTRKDEDKPARTTRSGKKY
jgi:hypothetical protein